MGCSGSSQAVPQVGASHVASATGKGDTTEGNRGLIASLSEQSILDIVETTGGEGRRMSISSETDKGKSSFANKAVKQLGDTLDATGIGFTCRKGLKPESPNQDSWFMLQMDSYSIYAVFDGHGQKGHDCSQFVKENLPKLIIKDPRFRTADMPVMLVETFVKTQSLLNTADRMMKLSAKMAGTTATVCIHDHVKNKLTTAHVADSTAVLARRLEDGTFDAVALTRDHKPELTDEKARIEGAGGKVVHDGYCNHRVYASAARYPGLNMSRCLGDLMGHSDAGVSCEPEVTERTIGPEDVALLCCSDGVWEFITPKKASEIVLEFPVGDAMPAAECLAKEAWDSWIREEGGSVVDDITVVLVHLNQRQIAC